MPVACDADIIDIDGRPFLSTFIDGQIPGHLKYPRPKIRDLLRRRVGEQFDEDFLRHIFGGLLVGLAVGIAYLSNSSTGGTSIAARLLKLRIKDLSIGKLTLFVDILVVIGTGLVFRDITSSLYSAVTLYVSSLLTDAVVYRFDYTKVVLIISDKYEQVADVIGQKLHRGVTMLHAQGYYRRQEKYVLLSAVKRHQLSELEKLVNEVDENAFVIVQEAHQVLGDGFKHYQENAL